MTITDVLAVSAIVLAIVTLVLDVTFFVLTWRGQVAFVNQMNERQDRLATTEIELYGKMSEVLAQVSERAKIVQEQVDRQMVRLTDFAIGRATSAGSEISLSMQNQIDEITSQLTAMSGGRESQQTIDDLKNQLEVLSQAVSDLPRTFADTARNSLSPADAMYIEGVHLIDLRATWLKYFREFAAKRHYEPFTYMDAFQEAPAFLKGRGPIRTFGLFDQLTRDGEISVTPAADQRTDLNVIQIAP